MSRYNLKYRTFEELVADATDDLELYRDEGLIDISKLVKVAQDVNSQLGLAIHQEKQAMLEVDHYKARLPNDFHIFNFGLLCFNRVVKDVSDKVLLEDQEVEYCKRPSVELCKCGTMHTNECGDPYKVIQKIEMKTYEYTHFDMVSLTNQSKPRCSQWSFNMFSKSPNQINIKDDYIYTNFESGSLYISYMGTLEDEDGNLLVLDHPQINNFYEYAIKRRVIENIAINKDASVANLIPLMDSRFREARTAALLIRNMPEYSEIKQTFDSIRRRAYNRYSAILY